MTQQEVRTRLASLCLLAHYPGIGIPIYMSRGIPVTA